ncbi:MAG: hypothetical protein WCQ70_06630 [Lentimicrobiaceae bacterium]
MNRTSLIAIILCALSILVFDHTNKFYKDDYRIIESDAKHYYSYIPAMLVYHDISLKFLDTNIGPNKNYFFTDSKFDDGRHYIVTTMGVAVLQSVFIVPLHYTLKLSGEPADGFSAPYKIAIMLSSLFYFILGLFLIRHLLIKRLKYNDYVTALTIMAIGIGTNIVVYLMREPGMSHVYSFFSIVLFAYVLDKFLHNPGMLKALLTGVCFGMVVLIRPINVLIGMLFILWDISSLKDLKERFLFYIKNPINVLLVVAGAIIIWIPQLMYYYYLTGSIFFSGYSDTNFYFNNPQIIHNLFSYRKGWFLYTPIMAFAVIGLIPLYKKHRNFFWPVISILAILVYVNSSWYSWWFGGGFGQRAYIEIYGLLAIPLAALINAAWSKKILMKIVTVLLVFVFIFHNIFEVKQYLKGAIHYAGMTREAYWYSFGRLVPGLRFYELIEMPDYEMALIGIYPKPTSKQKTTEEWIAFVESGYRKNPEMMKLFEEKAKSSNTAIDTLLRNDAKWALKQDKPLLGERILTSDFKKE